MIWVKVSPKTPVWKHYSDFLPKNAEPNGHFKRSKGLIVFKNVGILHSSQTNHIIHAGTIFHTVDRCFPNQFLQAKRRELTVFGITHWIPNTSKTPFHKAWEKLQWSRRCSTNSPSQQQHKQHLLTRDWPHLTRLSMMSIPSLVVVHKKKDTWLGTFAHQMHSQGNSSMRGLDNNL